MPRELGMYSVSVDINLSAGEACRRKIINGMVRFYNLSLPL